MRVEVTKLDLTEDSFDTFFKTLKSIMGIQPFKLLIDRVNYNLLDYNKIDSDIREMLKQIGGMHNFAIIYELLNEINLYIFNAIDIKSLIKDNKLYV